MQKLPKLIYYVFTLFSVLSLGFVIFQGPLMYADTRAYFGMWPYVSAGYPFFLRGLHFLFNENYPIVAVGIQYIAVVFSIFLFVKYFLSNFALKKYQYCLLLGLLFYPIFDENVLAINNVTTEGLSYAIFLQILLMSYLIFVKRLLKYYWILLVLSVILITIRGQFIFLTPLFLLIEGLLFYKERKIKFSSVVLILLIPLLTFTIDNVYHKIVQKQFFSTPFTWTALASSMLFVSEESDEKYLDTEEQRSVFNTIHESFRNKKIGYKDHKYHSEPIDYNYYFFHYEFPTICNQTVLQEVVKFYESKGESPIQSYLETERINKELFFELLPANFKKWAALVFQSIKTGLGGIFVLLIYIIALVLLLKHYFVNGARLTLFLALMLLLILCNRIVISVSVHSLTRYFFYTNWMPVLLFFIGGNKLLTAYSSSEKLN